MLIPALVDHKLCFFVVAVRSWVVACAYFPSIRIASIFSYQYRVTSVLRTCYDAEVFAGKGVLYCRVETPRGNLAIFNTHVSITKISNNFQ